MLRRLDCVLEPTKAAVLAEKAKRDAAGINPEPFLLKKSRTLFYNTSPLFLMHLISKMRPTKDGGGRFGIVLNGSPLFTGNAGSGESEIRRYVLENDMLEAIIGLPTDMFYNTGISTYVWIVTNRKPAHRKGKVQLIDASGMWRKMRKSLGSKRKELSDEHIAEITRLFGDAKDVYVDENGKPIKTKKGSVISLPSPQTRLGRGVGGGLARGSSPRQDRQVFDQESCRSFWYSENASLIRNQKKRQPWKYRIFHVRDNRQSKIAGAACNEGTNGCDANMNVPPKLWLPLNSNCWPRAKPFGGWSKPSPASKSKSRRTVNNANKVRRATSAIRPSMDIATPLP